MAVTIPRSALTATSLPPRPAAPVSGGDAATAGSAAFDALLDTEQKALVDGQDSVRREMTRSHGRPKHTHHTAGDDDESAVGRHSTHAEDDQPITSELLALAPAVPSAPPPVRGDLPGSTSESVSQADADASPSSSSEGIDPEGRRNDSPVPNGTACRPRVPDGMGSDAVTGGVPGETSGPAVVDEANGVSPAGRHPSGLPGADSAATEGLADKPSPATLPEGATLTGGQPALASRSTPALLARALLAQRVSQTTPQAERAAPEVADPERRGSDPSAWNRTSHASQRVVPPGSVPQGVNVDVPQTPAGTSPKNAQQSVPAADPSAPQSAAGHLDIDSVRARSATDAPATPIVATPWVHVGDERGGRLAGAQASPESRPPVADDTSLASQIVQRMRLQWLGNSGHAVVNLDPEYLGNVTIHLNIGRDGATTATLSADNDDVRSWAQAHEPLLRQQLAGQGLSLDRLDVVRDEARNEADQRDDRQQRWKPPMPSPAQNGRRKSSGTFEVVV